jgi:hypothetical protein|tara:strand:+ start:4027 stop:4467 length:441 start_codon:yes stop_codon:yes gene_type:complete
MSLSPSLFAGGFDESAIKIQFNLTVDETVEEGNILAVFAGGSQGQLRKARSATNQVIGICQSNATAGSTVNIVQHGLTRVRMNSAPSASDIGKPIYLSQSTNGVASLTAPTASGNNVIKIGYIYRANGVAVTIDVILSINFIVHLG